MAKSQFIDEAIAAGFTRKMAEFMEENVAEEGHSHEIEDIDGLEARLDGGAAAEEEDEEEDEPE